jgi:hypothetical protein
MSAALHHSSPSRLIPLSKRITDLLKGLHGRRASLKEICTHLGMPTGNTGEPWQNVCRVSYELAKLIEYEKIRFAPPDFHWIDPPPEPDADLPENPFPPIDHEGQSS